MPHQRAWAITRRLASKRVGVIRIVSNGKRGAHGGESAEFRYLLLESETAAAERDEGFVL